MIEKVPLESQGCTNNKGIKNERNKSYFKEAHGIGYCFSLDSALAAMKTLVLQKWEVIIANLSISWRS